MFIDIILPVVLYGCETWSLTLREERRLRVFENRVLGRILGPKRDEVAGKWRKLHDEELNDLYCSPNIFRLMKSRRMRWAGHVARMGERRGVYRVLVESNLKEKTRCRWGYNIKMNLQKAGCRGMGCIELAQDRDRRRTFMNAVMNLQVP